MTRLSPRVLWWLLVVAAGGVLAYFARFPAHFAVLGVNHYGVWFLDTYAILASNDALAHGLDVYRYNPLDYFGRPHVYPHWWLLLGELGFTRADTARLGFILGAAFFVTALSRLRPRSLGEIGWQLAILCSPAVLLGLNRANNDLVIFVLLAPVVPCLLARSAAARFLAIALIAVATALKTYPAIAALILLAGTDRREVRWRVGVMAAVFAVMSFDLVRDFARYGGLVPRPDGLMTFGAAEVFLSCGLREGVALACSLLIGAGLVVWLWRLDLLRDWRVAEAGEGEWLSFALGAILLTGCFFAGLSYGYRWIFAVWLLPLLWSQRQSPVAPLRRLVRATLGLLLVAVWLDALASAVLTVYAKRLGGEGVTRWANGLFLAEQPLTWLLFAALLVFVLRFGRDGWETWRGRRSPR